MEGERQWDKIYAAVSTAVKELLEGDCSGHDFQHTLRVVHNAENIAEAESCDKWVVILAALLHDADDVKLFDTRDYANARRILTEARVDAKTASRVIEAIRTVSFKGTDTQVPATVEGKIVQDADRLDAMGAVGIARAFAYGGSRGREMYNPDEPPNFGMDEAAYRSDRGSTLNHFYEKLFLLKGLMNTETGRRMAEGRDAYMHAYLEEFYEECGITPIT